MKRKTALFAAMAASVCMVAGASTLRVVSREADRTGDWTGAYVGMADALSAAGAGDTVLVASGTYSISATLEPAKANLTIRSANLATGEEDPSGTVLDGGGSVRIMNVKAKHVTVSGITFTRGFVASEGAAVRLESSNTANYFCITNCVFTGNRAESGSSSGLGGCIYSYVNQYGTIVGCTFTNNVISSTSSYVGGCAIYTQMNAEDPAYRILVRNCLFGDNAIVGTYVKGGVVFANRGIVLDGCEFLGSDRVTRTSTSGSNEGAFVRVGGYSIVQNCTFTGTTPDYGGYGTYFDVSSSGVLVSNCTFSAITETKSGYGLIYVSGNDAIFSDCRFTGNSTKGHMIYYHSKRGMLVRNCLFAGNSNSGSLINQNGAYGYTIENCTFAGNVDTRSALSSDGSTPCTNYLVNTVFTAPIEAPTAVKTVVASNCCLTALLGGESDSGNITPDAPGFKSPAKGDYRLLSTSPCVDAGLHLGWMDASALDLSGRPRINGGAVDIGCFERQAGELDSSNLVVADASDMTGDWSGASTDIQGVIDGADDGEVILVHNGEYHLATTLVISNKTVVFRSYNPSTGLQDRDGTVFVGTAGGDRAMVVSTGPIATANVSYGPTPVADHPIVIDGFTFRGFSSSGNGGAVWFGGQGAVGGTPATITNCTFRSNVSSGDGGAVFVNFGGRIVDCLFEDNEAGGRGGAIETTSDSAYSFNVQTWPGIDISVRGWYYPHVTSCIFRSNVSGGSGGAIDALFNIVVDGCDFTQNVAAKSSGGALRSRWAARVLNCSFSGNAITANGGYGSTLFTYGASIVSNCVVGGSSAGYGAVYIDGAKSDLLVVSCVSTNNAAEGFWVNGGTVRQCLSAGNTSGIRQFQAGKLCLNVENCTIVGNGVGIYNSNEANTNAVVNSILFGNTTAVKLSKSDGTQRCTVTNTLVDVDPPSHDYIAFSGTLKVPDAKFVDAAAGNYRLRERSPAREKAAVLPWMASDAKDLDGNPRRVSMRGLPYAEDEEALPDLGCYECQLWGIPPGIQLIFR